MLPLYSEHFGLAREPFSITPDPSFLYLSESHKEALAQLVYGIKARRGFVVLTGEVGTGKTTLIQCLLDELNSSTKTALVFNMIDSSVDLLRYVCEKFDLVGDPENCRSSHDYLNLLERFLLKAYQNGDNVALIIDEAQNLSTRVLENVRLLSNFETPRDKLLQILLVGQPELGTRLNDSEVRQIKQRVALRHHLKPLNPRECRDYIARRLAVAGGGISLFTVEALVEIYNYSAGIPRLVNILCDNGLLSAYALRKESVEAGMIAEIARDLELTMSSRHVVALQDSVLFEDWDASDLEPIERQPDSGDPRDVKGSSQNNGRQSSESALRCRGQPIADDAGKIGGAPFCLTEGERKLPTVMDSGAENVPHEVFEFMIRALTEAMGPMASLVVDDHVAAMGESFEAFPKKRLGQLVNAMSCEILSERLKASFQKRIFEQVDRIGSGETGR